MAESFDLIIIGTGSGNSIPPSLSHLRIAIVERDPTFGGTCLNRGCIPSKMLVLPADAIVESQHVAKLGLTAGPVTADWPAIRDRVFGRIDPISAAGRAYRAAGSPNVTLIEGTARFVGPKLIDVEGRQITADRILIAAGARPHIPDIAGLTTAGFETSDTIMRLDRLPRRLTIIGAGFIAVEMGHVFAGYGSEVTMFARGDRLLRREDEDVSARFTELFSRRVDLVTNTVPTSVARDGDGTWHIESSHGTVHADALLVATGRVPNVDLLDLDECAIRLDRHGVIEVDEHMATNVDGVWAIGDVANRWQLKHVANAEARVAFHNIAHHGDDSVAPAAMDYSAVPSAVFSNPQVASVGLTEAGARELGRPIRIGRTDYAHTAYGWALEDDSSFAKVILDADTGLVLGAHVLGPQAATLLQPLVQAMQFEQPAEQVARRQMWIHPALTEVVENALLAALEAPPIG